MLLLLLPSMLLLPPQVNVRVCEIKAVHTFSHVHTQTGQSA